MAKAEEKAVTTKKPSEITSRVEDIEHWMERFMDDMWRRPFPSLFGRDRWLPIRPSSIRMPSLDVYEEKDAVVVKAELPGMKKEEVEVNLVGESLTIKGEKKAEREEKKQGFHLSERRFGSFQRSFNLPEDADPEGIEAVFKNGVLTVIVPKADDAKAGRRKVEIKKA